MAGRQHRGHPSRTPPAEWVVGGLGLAAVVAMLVVLLGDWAAPRAAPSLSLAAGEARRTPVGWALPVRIDNAGDGTVAAVEIAGRQGAAEASAQVDYVPARGSATAALVFPSDPRSAPVDLSLRGYTEP